MIPDFSNPPKILLIEDEEQNALLIQDFLVSLPIELYKAFDGPSALKLIPIIQPDLILLDIFLPQLDGIEVCRHIKEDPKYARIPIIFITALADLPTHIRAIEAGGIAFITKPVQRAQLLAYTTAALRIKQSEDTLRSHLDQAKTAAGMLAHDIRNLLQTNYGYLHLLLTLRALPPEAADFIQILQQTTVESIIMSNTLLDIQKNDATGIQIVPQPFLLNELIRQRILYTSIPNQNRTLHLHLPEEDTSITTDPDLLARILDNLLLNALKFSPKNSAIALRLNLTPTYYHLSIENEGEPIPPKQHDAIFEPFTQAHDRAAHKHRGFGLGLTFCRLAAQALNATLTLQSPLPNRADGVAFHLILPK